MVIKLFTELNFQFLLLLLPASNLKQQALNLFQSIQSVCSQQASNACLPGQHQMGFSLSFFFSSPHPFKKTYAALKRNYTTVHRHKDGFKTTNCMQLKLKINPECQLKHLLQCQCMQKDYLCQQKGILAVSHSRQEMFRLQNNQQTKKVDKQYTIHPQAILREGSEQTSYWT